MTTMPTIHDTWDQLDQESIKIAWKELVDHKGFELARRVVERRLAQEAAQDLGYIPKWLDGPGPSSEDVVRLLNRRFAQEQPHNITEKAVQEEALASVRLGYFFDLLPKFGFEIPHVQKWIDALLETWRQQNRNEKETPEFLWAIFYNGVADEVILNKQDALVSTNIFQKACQYLEPLRDRVALEAHKLEQTKQPSSKKIHTLKEKLAKYSPYDTVTVKEVMDHFNMSKSRVHRYLAEGPFKKASQSKKGEKVQILVSSIADYLEEGAK